MEKQFKLDNKFQQLLTIWDGILQIYFNGRIPGNLILFAQEDSSSFEVWKNVLEIKEANAARQSGWSDKKTTGMNTFKLRLMIIYVDR